MAFLGVYGHVNVDVILKVRELPGPEQTVPVEKELRRLGGTAGNLARAAASLGVPAALASCVGTDFPEEFMELLTSAGIELVDLRKIDGPTPKIWILSSAAGKQAGVIDQGVMGDGVARPHLDYTMLNSTWVHFMTGPPEDHYRVAREAHRAGKRVAFDPAQELSFRYSDRAFERFLAESDLLFLNQAELQRALEKLGYGEPRQLLDHTKAVVETRGPQGVVLYTQKETLRVPACPVREASASETIGAGEAFRGGFYAALHQQRPLAQALRWGSVSASLYLETGASRFADLNQLRARLEEWHD